METVSSMPPIRKPSQVMAWLGFGISLALFIMIWGVNALVLSHIGDRDFPAAALYMLVILGGGFLGLMGLIFSIIGLVQATRNFVKKWPSVCGIIFCCLSLVSVFAPIIIASTMKTQTVEIQLPEQKEATGTDDAVMLYITDMHTIKCYDNRNGNDNSPAIIRSYSIDKKHELETWMQMNEIKKDANFIVKADTEVDYSEIVEILDILKELKITKFKLTSENSAR